MSFASLAEYGPTVRTLQKAAQILAAMRMLELEPAPLYLEQALRVCPQGLSSGILPSGLTLTLDYGQAAIILDEPGDHTAIIPLAGHSPASLFDEVLGAAVTGGFANVQPGRRVDALIDAILSRGRVSRPHRDDYTDTTPLVVDRRTAADYAAAMYGTFSAIARFRARLSGRMSPLVVWPEHFDLSFLWFATDTVSESAPHMNFGFAPYSAGFERPYLYAYAYPLKSGYLPPTLTPPAYWNTSPWTGCVLGYDDIRRAARPGEAIEAACEDIYGAQLKLLPTA